MIIHGLQKMTLLDFPGHVACTVFLGGCDFRCPFCHNYELIDGTASPLLDDTSLFSFLQKRTGLLDGVAITGGEPCLHPELPDLLRRIRSLGFQTKLDTNGYHPKLLQTIVREHLADYIAMDIKNSPAKYAATAGLASVDMGRIRESIRILTEEQSDYEFRTTAVDELHAEDDFYEIGELIRGAGRYFLQSFTDRDTVPYGNLHAPSAQKLQTYISIVRQYTKEAVLRGTD